MPMPTTAKWPKPKNEDEFEDIAVDFLRLRWKDPNAARNGRRGQRQHGVDVTGRPSWGKGRTAGAQCKNTESPTLQIVVAEVEKAKGFEGGLCEFLFLTAADRDSELQAAVRAHFATQPPPFPVELVFWLEIVGDLSANDELVAKHWKGFGVPILPARAAGPPQPRPLAWRFPWEGANDFCFEFALWPASPVNLDVSELSTEIEAIARQKGRGQIVSLLLNQTPSHRERAVLWSFENRPYTNIAERWELELGENGLMVFRWGERRSSERYVDVIRFVEGMLLPAAVYQSAIAKACNLATIPSPSKVGTRLVARGDGPLLLNDNLELTLPVHRLSPPESSGDWSVECEVDPSVPILDSGKRLVNRALARFKLAPMPAYWSQALGQVGSSTFLSINEVTFHKLYDPWFGVG